MMYGRVMEFALEFATQIAATQQEKAWVERLAAYVAEHGYGISFEAKDRFSGSKELKFWADLLFELAAMIYRREVGSQDNQDWQTPTIWATYDLARLLAAEMRIQEQREAATI